MMKKSLTFFLMLLGVLLGAGQSRAQTTHYISTSGADTANGLTKTTPWLHAPGMPNCSSACHTYQTSGPQPGDQLIFIGNGDWQFANTAAATYTGGTWVWTWNGSSTTKLAYKYPTSGVDSGGGGSAWTNPGNVTVQSNSTFATSTATTNTDNLDATGFGFSLPSNATITGIQVNYFSYAPAASTMHLQLLQGGSPVGTAKTFPVVTNSQFAGTGPTMVGSPYDLWGTTWTYSQVNASNFGVRIYISGATSYELNAVQIQVTYTVPGSGDCDVSDNPSAVRTTCIYIGVDKTWFLPVTGTVNTSGTAVTWQSGLRYDEGDFGILTAGNTITINGTAYTVASVSSAKNLTLTSSAGTQTGVSFSYSYWNRPIMDGGNPASATAVSSCLYPDVNSQNRYLEVNAENYNWFDNLEFTGICQQSTSVAGHWNTYVDDLGNGQGVIQNAYSNIYTHNFTHVPFTCHEVAGEPVGVCENMVAFTTGSGLTGFGPGNIVDGWDSAPQDVIGMIFGGTNVWGNVFCNQAQVVVNAYHNWHDNQWCNYAASGDGNSHGNSFESNIDAPENIQGVAQPNVGFNVWYNNNMGNNIFYYIPIASFSITSNVVTLNLASPFNGITYAVGYPINLSGFTTGTYLNGMNITNSGLNSAGVITFSFSHANVSTTADTGVGGVRPDGTEKVSFCVNSMSKEMWFNNKVWDQANGNNWDVAADFNSGFTCNPNSTSLMFNNTIETASSTGLLNCSNGMTVTGNFIIADTGNGFASGPCTITNDTVMSHATAVAQGYMALNAGTSGYNSNTTCANNLTPCAPTNNTNTTVGNGITAATLATYCSPLTSSPDPSLQLAGAYCLKGTTDTCTYNTLNRQVTCPRYAAVTRPTSGNVDAGADQFTSGVVSISPTSYGFGNVTLGSSATSSSFTLTNNSGSTITFATCAGSFTTALPCYTSAAQNDWTTASNTCTGTLTNASSCTLTVTFTPSVAIGGSESATLNVAFTGGAGSPVTVSLTGTSWGGTVATPAYDHGTGTYIGSVTVTITDSTAGASIFYCTDTLNTCTPSTPYSAPVTISVSGTYLRAQATAANYTNSAIQSALYTITPSQVPNPSCTPSFGVPPLSVNCTDSMGGATLCYTFNGSAPTAPTPGTCGGGSTTYTGAISISVSGNLQILGTAAGHTNSNVVTYSYSGTVVAPSATGIMVMPQN